MWPLSRVLPPIALSLIAQAPTPPREPILKLPNIQEGKLPEDDTVGKEMESEQDEEGKGTQLLQS